MGLPDILDVFVLLGAGLMAYGAEQIHPGAGFVLGGAALYLAGLMGGPTPTAPPADTIGAQTL